jgi:hypothetical protein
MTKPGLFGVAIALLMCQSPALARTPVNTWFCKVLKAPFDPKAAIAAFPLEKLPDPVETRKEDPSGDNKSVVVSLTSEGDKYKVEFRYQFKESNVTDPYGFSLSVADTSFSQEFLHDSQKWLAEFGKPTQGIFGMQVAKGEPMAPGMPGFYFVAWTSVGNYSANWFYPSYLKSAAEACH